MFEEILKRFAASPKERALVLGARGLIRLNKSVLDTIERGTYSGPFAELIYDKEKLNGGKAER